MGFWGTGAMEGDAPLDLRADVAEAAAKRIRIALNSHDDAEVFAAAHIAMDLYDADVLGFQNEMFGHRSQKLVKQIRERVAGVSIAQEWCGDPERKVVRVALLKRLTAIEAAYATGERRDKGTSLLGKIGKL